MSGQTAEDRAKLRGLRVLGEDVKNVTVTNTEKAMASVITGQWEAGPTGVSGVKEKNQIRNTQEQNSRRRRFISFLQNLDFKEVW